MPRSSLAACTCLLISAAGCARSGHLFPEGPESESEADPPAQAWGEYANTLDVPPCPAGEMLVVDTTAAELDGGTGITDPSQAGASLSLIEALWLAANRPGQDNIYFDRDIFPAASPATILLSSDVRVPYFATPVCVDGRGRGVVVDWSATSASVDAMWNLGSIPGAADLQVGLTLLRAPFEQLVRGGAQVAGCRYGTDGRDVLPGVRPWAIDLAGGRAGPGNVLVSSSHGVRAYSGSVHENYFGLDVVTRGAPLGLGVGIDVEDLASAAGLIVERNVFATAAASSEGGSFNFQDNVVDGCRGMAPAIALTGSHGSLIGPGNVIRGCPQAISMNAADALITRNSIFDNDVGIRYSSAPVAAPTILSATSIQIDGLCDVSGTVEVFSDAADQGEQFLGSVTCDGVSPWTLGPLRVPTGRNVTATLTDQQTRTSAFSAPVSVP